MDYISDLILKELSLKPNQKASEIAKKLSIKKRVVNQYLHFKMAESVTKMKALRGR